MSKKSSGFQPKSQITKPEVPSADEWVNAASESDRVTPVGRGAVTAASAAAKPSTKDTKVQLNVRIQPDLQHTAKRVSVELKMSLASFVEQALERELRERGIPIVEDE